MAVRIRLSRAGAKKRPHYRVIVADSRSPRDGRVLERVGTYHPLLSRDNPDRVKLKIERIKYWLEKGATPSGRVAKFLGAENLVEVTQGNNPQKAKPKAKAQERLDELAKASEEKEAEESSETNIEPDATEAPVETDVPSGEEPAETSSDKEDVTEEPTAPEPASDKEQS